MAGLPVANIPSETPLISSPSGAHLFREQPMTDEGMGHMTFHRLQERREVAGPLVISANPPGGHDGSLTSHNLWHEWNFNKL